MEHRYKLSVPSFCRKRCALVDAFFHFRANAFFQKIFFRPAGDGNDPVFIHDTGHMSRCLGKAFGVFLSECPQFPNGRIFLQNDFAFSICENFQRVAFPNSECAADFLWNDYSSQVIDSSDNASCSHVVCPPLCPTSVGRLFGVIMNQRTHIYVKIRFLSADGDFFRFFIFFVISTKTPRKFLP